MDAHALQLGSPPAARSVFVVNVSTKRGSFVVPCDDPTGAFRAVSEARVHGFGDVKVHDALGTELDLTELQAAAELIARRGPLIAFARRLLRHGRFGFDDWQALIRLPVTRRDYEPREIIIGCEDKSADLIGIVETGFVVCYKVVGRSACQPTSFALSGDAVDLPLLFFSSPSVHASACTGTVMSWIDRSDLFDLVQLRPMIADALWLETLIEAKIAREWIANIGQRRGREKIGHLMLELEARLCAVGQARDASFDLPVTQETLAAALGLSLVHYNKCFASLRAEGLIEKTGRRITLPKRDRLVALTKFDPSYLHFNGGLIRPRRSPNLGDPSDISMLEAPLAAEAPALPDL